MPERRRTFLKTIGGTAVALTLAGCGASEDGTDDGGEDMSDDEMSGDDTSGDDGTGEPEPESAGVNVAHLSPDAPNVDVYVDGDAVLEDVPFRTFSDYLDLTEGEYDIEITAAGDPDTVVFDQTVELGAGDFTAAAVGELAEENQPFSVEIFESDRELPDGARVRAIHASPDAPNVDITVAETGDALFEDVPFGAAGSVEVPAGEYTLEIRPATENNDGAVVASFDVELAAETVYTAAAVGYLEPDSAPADEPFDLEIAVDAE
jgi:hypothetical protein